MAATYDVREFSPIAHHNPGNQPPTPFIAGQAVPLQSAKGLSMYGFEALVALSSLPETALF
jgi:hypothetical protein